MGWTNPWCKIMQIAFAKLLQRSMVDKWYACCAPKEATKWLVELGKGSGSASVGGGAGGVGDRVERR